MANPSTQTTNTLITATLWNELVNDIIAQTARGFSVVFDGGGAALTSDTFIDVGPIPIACTISSRSPFRHTTAATWEWTCGSSRPPPTIRWRQIASSRRPRITSFSPATATMQTPRRLGQ